MMKGHTGRKRHRRGTTRATHGKLVRALDALESFYDADDRSEVVDHREAQKLAEAIRTIQDIESRLYNKGTT